MVGSSFFPKWYKGRFDPTNVRFNHCFDSWWKLTHRVRPQFCNSEDPSSVLRVTSDFLGQDTWMPEVRIGCCCSDKIEDCNSLLALCPGCCILWHKPGLWSCTGFSELHAAPGCSPATCLLPTSRTSGILPKAIDAAQSWGAWTLFTNCCSNHY